MKAVLQRVSRASVRTTVKELASIALGFLVLLGVAPEDEEKDVDWLVEKLLTLRVFDDGEGKMHRSLVDVRGEILVVSQFTLFADVSKGRRPSFLGAAAPEKARTLYELVLKKLRERGLRVGSGEFGAIMQVELVNDGPVTLLLDSREEKKTA